MALRTSSSPVMFPDTAGAVNSAIKASVSLLHSRPASFAFRPRCLAATPLRYPPPRAPDLRQPPASMFAPNHHVARAPGRPIPPHDASVNGASDLVESVQSTSRGRHQFSRFIFFFLHQSQLKPSSVLTFDVISGGLPPVRGGLCRPLRLAANIEGNQTRPFGVEREARSPLAAGSRLSGRFELCKRDVSPWLHRGAPRQCRLR